MPLFLIELTDRGYDSIPAYDVAIGFVIRASTPEEARDIAASNADDEGPEFWTNPYFSEVSLLQHSGPTELILKDSRDG